MTPCEGLRSRRVLRAAICAITPGNNLECSGGTFKNPRKVALSADGANVKGDVFLRDGFSGEGTVRLPGARIEGDLNYSRGKFGEMNGSAQRQRLEQARDAKAAASCRTPKLPAGGLAVAGHVFLKLRVLWVELQG